MTSKLKFALAVCCLGALTAPVVMAQTAPAAPTAPAPTQTQEFVAATPNVPQLAKPQVQPRTGVACGGPGQPVCTVPEPGSLPLVAVSVLAAYAVIRRKK